MKILIIGGHGTIGKVVTNHFNLSNSVLLGGRTSADINIDISDSQSIETALKQIAPIDAIGPAI